MTRDELRGIVEGISDEQLKRILDINSSDIGKAKLGMEEKDISIQEANKKIADMEAELGSLRDSQCEAEKMKTKIDELQKVIDERALEDERIAQEAALEKRFNSAMGTNKFLNDYTRNGIYALFSEALKAEENKGKSDREIFEMITKNTENLFNRESSSPNTFPMDRAFSGSPVAAMAMLPVPAVPKLNRLTVPPS